MLTGIHQEVYSGIQAVLEDEDDWVAAMATVVCELHNSFEHFHWTGFYRTVRKSSENRSISRRPWLFRYPL